MLESENQLERDLENEVNLGYRGSEGLNAGA